MRWNLEPRALWGGTFTLPGILCLNDRTHDLHTVLDGVTCSDAIRGPLVERLDHQPRLPALARDDDPRLSLCVAPCLLDPFSHPQALASLAFDVHGKRLHDQVRSLARSAAVLHAAPSHHAEPIQLVSQLPFPRGSLFPRSCHEGTFCFSANRDRKIPRILSAGIIFRYLSL